MLDKQHRADGRGGDIYNVIADQDCGKQPVIVR